LSEINYLVYVSGYFCKIFRNFAIVHITAQNSVFFLWFHAHITSSARLCMNGCGYAELLSKSLPAVELPNFVHSAEFAPATFAAASEETPWMQSEEPALLEEALEACEQAEGEVVDHETEGGLRGGDPSEEGADLSWLGCSSGVSMVQGHLEKVVPACGEVGDAVLVAAA
jgi:hypothetical protein